MDDLPAHLRRLREDDAQRHSGGPVRVRAVPAKGKRVSFASSKDISALVRMWTRSESSSPANVAVVEARRSSSLQNFTPPVLAKRQEAGQPGATAPRSSFAPCTKLLPPLLQDTIGYRPQAGALDSFACRPFSCVVVDLETTGFSPEQHEIVEVACVELRWNPPQFAARAVAVATAVQPTATTTAPPSICVSSATTDSGQRLPPSPNPTAALLDGFWAFGMRRFHRYVRPSSPASLTAASTAVHGITWDTVKDCDEWPVVAKELTRFLHEIAVGSDVASPSPSPTLPSRPEGESLIGCTAQLVVQLPPIVAHNASFDASFLEYHLQRCGYYVVWDAYYPFTCSMKWVRQSYPHVASNLSAACSFLGVKDQEKRAAGFHGAMMDAMLAARLFLQLCRRWGECCPIVLE
ncbi:exonuclease-like protein DNA polymerase III epsilon subunit-like exonuclease [Leptomonas seymouri]|uniref:Exonuclease-like protein DNA polymerase III epsilon subunit-like exonuclease n=1 Tax=Leptomonas seymouri TaxID=5684 RepID=A0A0N1IBJ5_LEPSE|nr:exonuclease-like protein DNA polymerase III epsilon subunit-like exonuclease [Leptomonas seymouri]|eukprot:KPI90114.1 exonuclease-like protein DNA polymerase III epsilon subunit-like exonuclease [Leptomonas seymouri]